MSAVGPLSHDRLQAVLDEVGGLYLQAGVARRLGVSRSRCCELVAQPGFPRPLLVGGSEMWAGGSVDVWDAMRRTVGPAGGVGRPRESREQP